MEAYLSPEDFETAKNNGIEYKTLYNRFYALGWPKQKAMTKPIMRKGWKWKDYEEACAKIGISKSGFYRRVKEGWSLERASTEPIRPLSERNKNKPGAKITDAIKETALKNGIAIGALKSRIYIYKWDVERAMTEPTQARFRRNDYETTRT